MMDEGEILDLVERKGPISLDGIMDQQGTYSRDEVYSALVSLKRDGKVEMIDGSLEVHGTTKRLWNDTTGRWG